MKTIAQKLADFIGENYKESEDASIEAELLGALAYQAGGILAHLGGPEAPEEITEWTIQEFVKLVRQGVIDGRKIMKGGDKIQ
jgi:hypothetical protein